MCYGEGEDKVNYGDDCKCLEVLIGLSCYGIFWEIKFNNRDNV